MECCRTISTRYSLLTRLRLGWRIFGSIVGRKVSLMIRRGLVDKALIPMDGMWLLNGMVAAGEVEIEHSAVKEVKLESRTWEPRNWGIWAIPSIYVIHDGLPLRWNENESSCWILMLDFRSDDGTSKMIVRSDQDFFMSVLGEATIFISWVIQRVRWMDGIILGIYLYRPARWLFSQSLPMSNNNHLRPSSPPSSHLFHFIPLLHLPSHHQHPSISSYPPNQQRWS